jgi:biopolymer transport protein TolQ
MNPASLSAALSPLQMFLHADAIVKSIIVMLLLASLTSWAVIVDKLWRFLRLQASARAWLKAASTPAALDAYAREPGRDKDPIARVYGAVIGEWNQTHAQGLDRDESGRGSLRERIGRVGQIASNIEIESLQRGLQILATIGSVAPFIGLFGTVWGIMNSFQGIAATNTTNLAVVAPGIAEALFVTALGLVTAVPAVVAYNRASGDLNSYAHRLATLLGVVEVHLSRQLESGEAWPDSTPVHGTAADPAKRPRVAEPVVGVRLAAQGA